MFWDINKLWNLYKFLCNFLQKYYFWRKGEEGEDYEEEDLGEEGED